MMIPSSPSKEVKRVLGVRDRDSCTSPSWSSSLVRLERPGAGVSLITFSGTAAESAVGANHAAQS